MNSLAKQSRLCRLACLGLWLAGTGCEPAAVPPILDDELGPNASPPAATNVEEVPTDSDQADPSAEPEAVLVQAGERAWISHERLPWDSWYLHYLGGVRVGYSHVVVAPSSLQGTDRIQITRKDRLEFSGDDGTQSRFERDLDATENVDGRLVAFSDQAVNDGQTTLVQAQFNDLTRDTLTLKIKTDDKTTQERLAWVEGTWGVMGVQSILLLDPLAPGERRTARVLVPEWNQIASATLVAGEPDLTSIPGGRTESLIPVDVTLEADDRSQQSRNWINSDGEIMKTIALSGPSWSLFRAPPEQVERTIDEFALRDLIDRVVPISGYVASSDAESAMFVVEKQLKFNGPAIDLFSLLEASGNQSIQSIDAFKILVTVKRAAAGGGMQAAEQPVDEVYLAPSPLVPSQTPEIEALARRLVGEITERQEIAMQLTSGLHQNFQTLALSREFSNVLQVARQQNGDCAEQAVLLTALLRNRSIPARVASGLRVDPANERQMVFHMWTEARLNGRWLPLDATEGTVAEIDRIKFFSSPMLGVNPYRAILPVLENMDQLQISFRSQD